MNAEELLRGLNGRHLLALILVAGGIALAFRLTRRARRAAADRAWYFEELANID